MLYRHANKKEAIACKTDLFIVRPQAALRSSRLGRRKSIPLRAVRIGPVEDSGRMARAGAGLTAESVKKIPGQDSVLAFSLIQMQ